jgi:hypothetical protein
LAPAVQTVPHAPQLRGSLARLVHASPQSARGSAHVAAHAPAAHTDPAAQVVPQPPQRVLSVRVFASQPFAGLRSQSAKPAAHDVMAHAPAAQVDVALGSAHARPQAPQCAAAVSVLVSQPLEATASQSPEPATQRSTVHAPAAHPFDATLGSEHALPHAPQLAGSTEVLAQNALAPVPQVASGAAQVVPHTPPEHTRPAVQAVPHAPQLALSVRVFTSQPLAGFVSQSAKPAAQAAMAHAPAAQLAVALGSAHARPHAPQWATAVRVLVSQPFAATASQSPKPAAQRATVHAPAAQPCAAALGSAHALPQAPQLAGSIAVLAQNAVAPAPHVASGGAQVVPHTPPEHTCPAGHTAPHAPQLEFSMRVFTSQPLAGFMSQSAKPAAQVVTAHAPATQVEVALPSAHTRPQAPQFDALVPVSTHAPPQSVCPAGHTHAPATQLCPPAHARPQAPQSVTSVRSAASQPLTAALSQLPKPAAQRTTTHAPAAQPFAAVLARAHTLPHDPQFDGSTAVLAQNAPAPAPHVASGAAQVVPHTPAEHTRPAGHAAPHAPQAALSVRVSTSQPLAGLMSQSAKPAAQAVTAHAPAAHDAVALGSAHARPQAPQWVVAVVTSVSQPLAAAPSQSPKPAAQRPTVHSPAAHPLVAALASAQARPHAPQWAGSIAVLAQNALAPAPQVASGAAHTAPHTPSAQSCPAGQALPQPPQLRRSVRVSAQYADAPAPASRSPQVARPAPHETSQRPMEHTRPPGHTLPHAPQLALSVADEMQRPPQLIWSAPQRGAHTPARHTSPASHARPHAPQWAGSVWSSTQRPAHACCDPVHTGAMSPRSVAASPT